MHKWKLIALFTASIAFTAGVRAQEPRKPAVEIPHTELPLERKPAIEPRPAPEKLTPGELRARVEKILARMAHGEYRVRQAGIMELRHLYDRSPGMRDPAMPKCVTGSKSASTATSGRGSTSRLLGFFRATGVESRPSRSARMAGSLRPRAGIALSGCGIPAPGNAPEPCTGTEGFSNPSHSARIAGY